MTRPNVLWIMADELRTDALGCYGARHPRVVASAIDALATSGSLFERAFTVSPICVPARAAMLTGQSPLATGVLGNEAYDQPERLGLTFPEVLAENGWLTMNFGKEHLPGGAVPWQYSDEQGSDMAEVIAAARASGSTIRRTPGLGHVFSAPIPAHVDFPSNAVTHNAASAIREARQPFLIRASYLQPHRPAVVPEPWASAYANVCFGVDASEAAAGSEFERQFGRINRGSELGVEDLDLALQMYYGAVAWLDAQVASLVAAIEDADLLDSTIVLFTSDHGAHVGEAGGFGKHTFAPESHLVPLIVSGPGAARGVRRADLATSEDIAATVLGLVGIAAPAGTTGRNLFVDEAPASIRSAIGYGEPWSRAFPNRDTGTWADGRGWPQRVCIRTRHYRLDCNTRIDGASIPLDSPDADLFLADSAHDPPERRNLIADPRYAGVREVLIGQLRNATEQLADVPRLDRRLPPASTFGAV